MPRQHPIPYSTTEIPVTGLPPELMDAERRFRLEAAADRATVQLLFSNTYQQIDDFISPQGSRLHVGVLDFAKVPLKPTLHRLMTSFIGSLGARGSLAMPCQDIDEQSPVALTVTPRQNDSVISYMPADNVLYVDGRKRMHSMTSGDDFTGKKQAVLSFIGVGGDLRAAAVTTGAELARNRLTTEIITDQGNPNNRYRFSEAFVQSVGVLTGALASGLTYYSYKDSVKTGGQSVNPLEPAVLTSGTKLSPLTMTFSDEVYESLADGDVPSSAVPLMHTPAVKTDPDADLSIEAL